MAHRGKSYAQHGKADTPAQKGCRRVEKRGDKQRETRLREKEARHGSENPADNSQQQGE